MEICTNVMEQGNLYGYWQIAPDTWCITDHWQNFIYLLEGKERAMLIDSGSGEGDIRKVVEQITDKPVMVVNTHGHFDHTGGNSCWPEAWMAREAAVHAKEPFGPQYSEWFYRKSYPDYKIHFLEDKEKIDLGDREVEVIAIPAHSEGSVALLDHKVRFLFSGDEIESGQVIWFVRNEPLPLSTLAAVHKANMEMLLGRIGEYDLIWPAHNGAPLLPEPYLRDFITLDEKIMGGTQEIMKDTAGFGFPPDNQAVPNLFMEYGALLRAQWGLASVVYTKKKTAGRELFTVRDMGDGIRCIEDASNVMCWLIEGKHHALLVDTGTGVGNLNHFVKILTELPVYTVITHGHVDHAGGCYDFDEVYISPEDLYLLPETTNVQLRQAFARKSKEMAEKTGMPAADWNEHDFTPPGPVRFNPLYDGMEFELGERKLTAVAIPGHTAGFTALFDERTGNLFAGDGGNPSTFMFLKESTSLEEYYMSLLRLKECCGDRITRWFISHAMPEVPVTILDELIECCEAVFEGRADGPHFEFDFADMGSDDAYSVYQIGEDQLRQDGHLGNIIYNRRNIQST